MLFSWYTLRIFLRIFFEILHTITSLCLEKSDAAQFLKNNLLLQNGPFLPQLGPKKLTCFVLGIHSHDFCKLFMMMRHIAISKILNGIPPNISFLGKWAIWVWFGRKYEPYISALFWDFAVWYSAIASLEWFKYAQESLDFSESTALFVLFMWSLPIQQLHSPSQQ